MLEFAGVLSKVDPAAITTYQIEAPSARRSRATPCSIPEVDGDNMKAILDVFRGRRRSPTHPSRSSTRPTTVPPIDDTTDDHRRRPPASADDDRAGSTAIDVAGASSPTRTATASSPTRRHLPDRPRDIDQMSRPDDADRLSADVKVEGAGEAGGGIGRAGDGGDPGADCGGRAPRLLGVRLGGDDHELVERAPRPRRRRPARSPGSPTAARSPCGRPATATELARRRPAARRRGRWCRSRAARARRRPPARSTSATSCVLATTTSLPNASTL